MGHPQSIKTESGEELVVLTRQDYDALIARANDAADGDDEDDDDVALYDARKAAMAKSGETPLPDAVNTALMRGDSLLRALRRWRGLSQTAVAKQTGLGQGYLSDLESRRRTGTQETLAALAAALGVPGRWLTGGSDSDRVD